MVQTREYAGYKSVKETRQDFRRLFALWGVDPSDWVMEALAGGGYTVRWWLPYENAPYEVTCQTQRTEYANLRVIYHFVESLQRNSVRGVLAKYGGQTFLALPVGDRPSNASGQSGPRKERRRSPGKSLKGLRAACEVLGVREDAAQEVVDAAYRAIAKTVHPDTGAGDMEAMTRLNEARDLIYRRRNWT